MKVSIEIVDAWIKDCIGKVVETDEDGRLFFPCSFAQCYGEKSGMAIKPIVRDMMARREVTRKVKVNCGGYGDRGHAYHCDNYLTVIVTLGFENL